MLLPSKMHQQIGFLDASFASIWLQKVAGATREDTPREDQGNEDRRTLSFPLDCPASLISVYSNYPGQAMTERDVNPFHPKSNWSSVAEAKMMKKTPHCTPSRVAKLFRSER